MADEEGGEGSRRKKKVEQLSEDLLRMSLARLAAQGKLSEDLLGKSLARLPADEKLSEDLVRSILARLAPQELVQAQLVCKKWKSVVREQRARQGEPWFLFAGNLRCGISGNARQPFLPWPGPGPEGWTVPAGLDFAERIAWTVPAGSFPLCWAYDPARKDSWFQVKLPASLDYRHVHFCGSTPASGVVALVERAGFRHLHFEWATWATDLDPELERRKAALELADLNALAKADADAAEVNPCLFDTVWIGNPLRSSWRRVPCGRSPFTDLVVGHAGSFKLVQHRQTAARRVQGRDECAWGMRVFDSVTSTWTEQAPVRTSSSASTGYLHCDSAVGDGGLLLYLKAVLHVNLQVPVAEVLSYSVEKDEWSVVAPAGFLLHPKGSPSRQTLRVFEHQGAVAVLAGICVPEAEAVRIFGFYRYDAEAKGWAWDEESEVWLPDHFHEVELRVQDGFHAVGGGGHVQLLSSVKRTHQLFLPRITVLKYEASSKRWSTERNTSYPNYPSAASQCWEDSLVAFHPRLDLGSESEPLEL